MSTIPEGLRADYMRKRMEDKATITVPGGLYVGGTSSTAVNGTSFYPAVCLAPGSNSAGLPLVSNGPNAIPSYQQVNTGGIADQAVTLAKMGNGTVVAADSTKQYVLSVENDSNDANVLVIRYYAIQD